MTNSLWTGELVETFHEPAFPNRLALFEAFGKHEVIVQYDGLSPWTDSVERRTYFLRENAGRIAERKKPRFAASNATNKAVAIPIFHGSDLAAHRESINGTCASTSSEGNSFTIFQMNRPPDGPYYLPAYRGSGTLKLVALTPITVTLDASIVGGVVAYWILYGLASSGHGVIYQSH